MHSIQVEDPWFGEWWKFTFTHAPTYVWIGPLCQRSMVQENLANYGAEIERNSVREKPCDHKYVEGLVTGNVESDNPMLRCVLGPRGGGSAHYMEIHNYGQNVYTECTYTMTSWSEDLAAGTFSAVLEEQIHYHGWPWDNPRDTYSSGTAGIRGSVEHDRLNGTTLYHPVSGDCNPRTGTLWSAVFTDSFCPYSGGTGIDNGLGAFRSFQAWTSKVRAELPQPAADVESTVRDEAIYNAIENLQLVNINWLNDYDGVTKPISSATKIANSFKGLSSAMSWLKTAANLHLLWKYVVKTNLATVDETQVLKEYLTGGLLALTNRIVTTDMVGHGTASVSYTDELGTAELTYTVKAVYESGWSPFGSLSQLQQLGMLPEADDLWDMIPYSFVMDWCVPVQGTIKKLQGIYNTLQLPLVYLLVGRKLVRSTSRSLQAGTHEFTIALNDHHYSRRIRYALPSSMSLGSLEWTNPLKHGLTGSALLIQRL